MRTYTDAPYPFACVYCLQSQFVFAGSLAGLHTKLLVHVLPLNENFFKISLDIIIACICYLQLTELKIPLSDNKQNIHFQVFLRFLALILVSCASCIFAMNVYRRVICNKLFCSSKKQMLTEMSGFFHFPLVP